jgi:hypothetical protein
MIAIETPSDLRIAFDTLLAGCRHVLRLYDRDLALFEFDDPARHAALRAFCVAGGGRRVEVLLDDVDHVARAHPRLMQLVRDFGHVLRIRQSDPHMPRPDEAFVLADRLGVLLRADKSMLRASLYAEDAAVAAPLHQSFDAMWQRSPLQVSATTLGL